MRKELFISIAIAILPAKSALAENPIVPAPGPNGPHVRIFNDKAYFYAAHDLVNRKHESVLGPESTYSRSFCCVRCSITDTG